MDSGHGWRLGRRPALDGVRGVAILLVLVGHGYVHRDLMGPAGVAVFFALSGFLITTLLLERRDRTGTSGFGAFYLRRARRLLPALGVLLAVIAVGSLWWRWLMSSMSLFASAFYVQNIQVMNHPGSGALAHLWSLSVEEQFYLLWPVALMLAVSRGVRGGLALAVTVVAASLGFRLWLLASAGKAAELHIYFGSETNACLLAAGCVVAFAARDGWSLPSSWFWPLLGSAGLVGLLVPYRVWSLTLVPVLAASAAAMAVLTCVGEQSPRTPRWLNLVGRRSYALYLWHFPLMVVIPDHLDAPRLLTVPIGLALAWGATCASWRWVERPAMRWSRAGGRRVDVLVPAEAT